MKHLQTRYSDFIVNEISLTGEVVHLTSFELPSEAQEVTKNLMQS